VKSIHEKEVSGMEAWKSQLIDRVEVAQHFLESKEINSYKAVKEYFKNVFVNFLNEVDNNKTGITEKKHEIYFYLGEMSMAIIDQGDNITIWKLTSTNSKIEAILSFEDGHCFVKYVNPVKVVYLSEDEIEKIFEQVFLKTVQTH
jgi:hypothetical protein